MTVTLELPPDKEAALNAAAQAQGVSAEQWLRRLVEERLHSVERPVMDRPAAGKDDRPIWEVILEEIKDVPREAFAALPKDGASQIDHYIYGTPRREA